MYLQLERIVAAKLMRKLVTVALPNASLPQLAGVFIEADADSGEVVLTSTNIESAVSAVMPAKVKQSGCMLVNAALFCNMLNLASGKTVVLKQTENLMVFQSGKTKYDIVSINLRNYPKPIINEPENMIAVKELPSLIRRTSFAAVRNMKPDEVYCNLKFVANGDSLEVTATDKVHLANARTELVKKGKLEALIPLKSVLTFSSMVEDDTEVSIGFDKKRIVFKTNEITYSANAINKTVSFLDEKALMQKRKDDDYAILQASELLNVLSNLSLVSGNLGTVNFILSKEEIKVTCCGELGTARAVIPVQIANCIDDNEKEYWFRLKGVVSGARSMQSVVKLYISENGMLYMLGFSQCFLQASCKKYIKLKKETANDKDKNKKGKAA